MTSIIGLSRKSSVPALKNADLALSFFHDQLHAAAHLRFVAGQKTAVRLIASASAAAN
jgi:hypothetical protein